MDFVALILLILILSVLIFLHELGHFITAKKSGAYVYEFAIGMGPKLFSFKRKNKNDPTEYSLRAFPIGGFCAIAGEVGEDDGMDVKLKKDQYMCNKPAWVRCIILIAGVTMNFLTGIVILLISALIWGSVDGDSYVGVAPTGYPISEAGIEVGDKILKIDNMRTGNWDKITLALNLKHDGDVYKFTVKKKDGSIKEYNVTPKKEKNKDGEEVTVFGFGQDSTRQRGILASIKYAFKKSAIIISSMCSIIGNLFIGKLSLSSLSGPVGVYSIVGQAARTSVESVLYLMAYLSLNLAFINILPFPAFDGGRVLFIIIEKIRGKKMNPKVEDVINNIGFGILMLLMAVITIKDILKLI